MTVLRPGRCFWVILHGEDRLPIDGEAFQRAVEQRCVCHADALRQAVRQHNEAMVLTGYLNVAGFKVLHRMVRPTVTVMHLFSPRTECQSQDLVA